MKTFKFIVKFEGNGHEIIDTIGFSYALILACANRIHSGLHINATEVTCEEWEQTYRINPKLSLIANWS